MAIHVQKLFDFPEEAAVSRASSGTSFSESLAQISILKPRARLNESSQSADIAKLGELIKQASQQGHLASLAREIGERLCNSTSLDNEKVSTAISHLQHKRNQHRSDLEREPYKPGSIIICSSRSPESLARGIDPKQTKSFEESELKKHFLNSLLAKREVVFRSGQINFDGSYDPCNTQWKLGSLHALQFVEDLSANLNYFFRTRPDLLYSYLLIARKSIIKVHDRYLADMQPRQERTRATIEAAHHPNRSRDTRLDQMQLASGERDD